MRPGVVRARILGGAGPDGGQWLIVTTHPDFSSPRIAILGGGPGGYEAAMVAASLGAKVTIIERAGLGGSAVLTDVVPSKTLIATADLMTRVGEAGELGVKFDLDGGDCTPTMRADLKHINDRLLRLARQQSADIQKGLEHQDVRILLGSGRLLDSHTIEVLTADGTEISRGGRDPAGRRRPPARAAHRPPGRRADPELGADLQPGRAPRGPDRGRLRRDRRRVRLRLQRPGLQGHPDFQPRPRAARLGHRRRRGPGGRLRTPRREGALPRPRRDRGAHRGRRHRHPRRRLQGHRQPLPGRRRLHPEHRRDRPRGSRRGAHRERPHQGRRRLPHHRAEHLRRRRLHRRAGARLRGRHAGPDRDRALPGRQRDAAQAAPGRVQHLHLARRSRTWASPRRRSSPASTRPTS